MTKKKQQQPVLTFVIIFVIGFFCGAGFAVIKMGSGSTPGSTPQQAATQSNDTSIAISNLEAEVTANPENFKAWVDLGHRYFDSNQYAKAISAYTTSLNFHSGDANLLTDLGVMYRRTGEPQKAIEWFKKAQAMNPQHEPSRFNEGIVRYYDLKDTQGAIASWEELLRINPDATGGNGQKISEFVEHIKAEQAQK
ncbi:tetratricopeptide repeat protein [Desulfosediminicola flagellatus]|uniref:tetratricopeptide repeat protein n=1 Tax=Desulfosediminicola flagellatus TaxID=2569541 RepID=UPI0010ACBBC6|nr:tetratricopeptide repeat protein [Desulfosediminicola flagellatus]